jgi:uncharacterized protein (DUF433 family)
MIMYKNIITIDPNIRFGKPCVKGTRISVYDVLGWLASGMSNEQILTDFPELKSRDIQACLAYAAEREHKLKIAL